MMYIIFSLMVVIICEALLMGWYKYRSEHDLFTGLYNKDWLLGQSHRYTNRLIRWMQRTKQTGAPFGMMFIDLDGFKGYNDTKGHQQGDDLLKTIASILKDVERRYIGVRSVRFGGDEMIVLMRETLYFIDVAQEISQRIDGETEVTASIGAAFFTNRCPVNQQVFMDKVDGAMYRVKQNGKNGISIAGV